MLKRLISALLVILLCTSVGIIPAGAMEEEQITVHYYNENNWQNPYLYYYTDEEEPLSWPGAAMQKDETGWYSYTIPHFSSAKIIFSDSGENQYPAIDEEGLLVEGEQWYKNGQFYDTNPDQDGIMVHFYNVFSWNAPYIYFYSDGYIPIDWPGKPMHHDGDGWYSYYIGNMTDAKVIFSNNGAPQDPASDQEGYDISEEKWYASGTWYDSKPEGITVNYYNYDNWDQVNICYYSGKKPDTDLTGIPMRANGDGWYTYNIYGSKEAYIFFDNGGSVQIPNKLETGFRISGEVWYRKGTWTDKRPEEITVHFYKPDDWDAPNIYYYINGSDTGPVWPGSPMNDDGDNWYSYTITKYDSAKILFNSADKQIPEQFEPGFDVSGKVWYKDGVLCNETSDTDNDGLPDYAEMLLGTNLNEADTDGDGLPDGYEVTILGTDPTKADSDDNGIDDGAEDMDEDGLTSLQEYLLGTDPKTADTDGDGLPDGYEVTILGTNPTKADSDDNGIDDGAEDMDEDGLTNLQEYLLGTDPKTADTDGDGLPDGYEVTILGTDPTKADSDDNGIDDGAEDMDEDGLTNLQEYLLGTDPKTADTDGGQ